MRKKLILASTAIALSFSSIRVSAQSEPTKVELGGHFTSITKPDSGGSRVGFGGSSTEPGFGGRFTFNFNRSIAVEAEGNFFPRNCRSCNNENVGNLAQGFFGVKAGNVSVSLVSSARPDPVLPVSAEVISISWYNLFLQALFPSLRSTVRARRTLLSMSEGSSSYTTHVESSRVSTLAIP